MRMMNCTKILLLLMLTLGLSSCNEENTIDDYLRNSDAKLCSKVWIEEYETADNELCAHSLQFADNGTGKEVFQFTPSNGGKPHSETFHFGWSWIDADMEGLMIDYGANDVLFFDNVWVREHYLSGKLDGDEVTFVDKDYYN